MNVRRGLIRSVVGLIGGVALALVGANLVDWYHFHRAVARCHAVTAEEWQRMATRCVVEKGHYERFAASAMPEEFAALRPDSVVISHGVTDLEFYQRGDLYLYLRIESYEGMQRAFVFGSLGGGQTTVDLWNSNPAWLASMHPRGRVLTIHEWRLRQAIEWVVLPTEIQIFERSSFVSVSDRLRHTAPLSESARRDIEAAAASLKPEFRGRRYSAEAVSDGTVLTIAFDPDGESRDDSVELANAWRPEIKPLLDAISVQVPEDLRITFEASVTGEFEEDPSAITVRTWDEVRQREARFESDVPWWCLWPKFARPIERSLPRLN